MSTVKLQKMIDDNSPYEDIAALFKKMIIDPKVSYREMYKATLVFSSDPAVPLSQEEAWRRVPHDEECSQLLREKRPLVFFRLWLHAIYIFGGGLILDKIARKLRLVS